MPLGAQAASINATLMVNILTHRATVYGRVPTGQAGAGTYAVVLQANLPCRLEAVNRQAAATGPDRAALAAVGTFRWDATYTMPAGVQIEVDAYPGVRWNVSNSSIWADDLPGIGVVGRTCDCVRAN